MTVILQVIATADKKSVSRRSVICPASIGAVLGIPPTLCLLSGV